MSWITLIAALLSLAKEIFEWIREREKSKPAQLKKVKAMTSELRAARAKKDRGAFEKIMRKV